MLRALVLISLVGMLGACAASVGGVKPEPTVRRVSPLVPKKLRVYLGPDIKEKFSVQAASLKPLEVDRYRGSVAAGAKYAFQRIFQGVQFVTNIPKDKNPYLILHYAKPKHVKKAVIVSGGAPTNYEVAIKISYDCELYSGGKKIKAAGNTVVSDDSTSLVSQISNVMKSALEAMFIDLVKSLITDETVAALKSEGAAGAGEASPVPTAAAADAQPAAK